MWDCLPFAGDADLGELTGIAISHPHHYTGMVDAQSAIDRFTSNCYDLIIEGESYRSRLKPTLHPPAELLPS